MRQTPDHAGLARQRTAHARVPARPSGPEASLVARLHVQQPAARLARGHRLLPGVPLLYHHRRRCTRTTAAHVQQAVARAQRNNPPLSRELFEFVRDMLLLQLPGLGQRGRPGRAAALRRQVPAGDRPGDGQGPRGYGLLSSTTACCRSTKWAAMPDRFGVCPRSCTAPCQERQANWPWALSPSPRTTPSAARMCGRGSTCCRSCRRSGRRACSAGATSTPSTVSAR